MIAQTLSKSVKLDERASLEDELQSSSIGSRAIESPLKVKSLFYWDRLYIIPLQPFFYKK